MSNVVSKTNGIWEWHDVVKAPNEIVSGIRDDSWQYYTNKGGGETIIGRSAFIWPGEEMHSTIMKAFFNCVKEYSEGNGLAFTNDNVGQSWLLVREYNTGSKMSAHNDRYSYVKKDGDPVIPLLTAILYINDDYEGGEINFIEDGVCISPKAGSMVVFPSNKQHEVLEILNGDRYMTQTYVYEHPVSFYDKDPNLI